MTLRAKVNGKLRVVSKAMARRFASRGVVVIDDTVPVEAAPPVVEPDATKTLIEQVKLVVPGVTNAELAAKLAEREAEARAQVAEKSFAEAAAKLAEEKLVSEQLVDTSQTLSLDFPNGSNVRGATLDTLTGIVTVRFKNGQSARYSAFTADLMAQWKAASSAGSWFHNNVKTKPDHHKLLADEAK